jgi:hypothetical protein
VGFFRRGIRVIRSKESPERVPGLQGHEEIHLEEEMSLGSPTISNSLRRAIKKGLRRAAIAFLPDGAFSRRFQRFVNFALSEVCRTFRHHGAVGRAPSRRGRADRQAGRSNSPYSKMPNSICRRCRQNESPGRNREFGAASATGAGLGCTFKQIGAYVPIRFQ